MVENPGDPLEKILQTVKALEEHIRYLGDRLDALERQEGRPQADALKPPPLPAQPAPPADVSFYRFAPAPVLEPLESEEHSPAGSVRQTASEPLGLNQILHKAGSPAIDPAPPVAPLSRRQPEKPKESWEVRIAGTWLPRVGILFLALVLILVARQHVHGPVGKVVGCYLLSIVLTGLGLWKGRKYPQWAAPVLAGGLAFSYFTSYAMGFVEPMQLLQSLPAKLAVLAFNLAVVFGFAQWKKSEVIAGTALILGYLTTGVTGNDVAGLCSMLVLSVIALLFLARNSWFRSTALAAGATYLSYAYIWNAVPEAAERTQAEAFWFHFLFLSLAFVVYTAAGFIGKKAALLEAAEEKPLRRSSEPAGLTRLNLLTMLTQTNVAAYIVGMIMVLKLTQVYWDQAWVYFFPTAAVCAVLAAAFAGVRPVQIVYLLAATFCFTLGVISASSPMWLPVFLTLQAVAMLAGARNREHAALWGWLSLLVLLHGAGYLVTGGTIGWAVLSTPVAIHFPWWPYAVISALVLIYAALAERPDTFGSISFKQPLIIPVIVAAGAFLLWHRTFAFFEKPDRLLIFAMGVPAVAVVSAFGRVRSLFAFVGLTAIVSVFHEDYPFLLQKAGQGLGQPYILLGLAGLCAAWLTERKRLKEAFEFRLLWLPVYVWSQFMLAAGMAWISQDWLQTFLYVLVFAATIAGGGLLRSAALAKSGFVIVFFAMVCGVKSDDASALFTATGSILLLLAAAYPLATSWWRSRTGDRWPAGNQWGQAAVVLVAGFLFLRMITLLDGSLIFAAGAWALVSALYAATGRFRATVAVTVIFASLMTLFVCLRLMISSWEFTPGEGAWGGEMWWSLAGVMLVVAAERFLKFAPRLSWPWSDTNPWLKPETMKRLTNVVAVGMLFTAITALRLMPELRVFYFTGAMVGAAFVWIVLGFWFHEPVYRKSGFALLCFGILKGLVWDVLELKNSLYRQISWTILGLLALAASFLYNKFRGRME